MSEKGILIYGYGNPGRQDDGLGPAVAEAIEKDGIPGVDSDANYQLNVEDAAEIAEFEKVIFVDASKNQDSELSFKKLEAAQEIAFTSHSVSPQSVLAICEEHFGKSPEVWLLGVRGYSFEMLEGLTPQGTKNLNDAVAFVRTLIRTWRKQRMEKSHTKTILVIDDDPDIRAALRMVLEGEDFSVGEASTGEEGLKIAERIKPDAIIVDLMMETVDAGSNVAQKLKEDGYSGPIYLLSAAGDTVRYNIDARELGLSGIFQKPIDPKTLVTTLKAKFKD